MSPFVLSIYVASIALVLVIVVGIVWNYIMHRYHWRGLAVIDAVLTLPLVYHL